MILEEKSKCVQNLTRLEGIWKSWEFKWMIIVIIMITIVIIKPSWADLSG